MAGVLLAVIAALVAFPLLSARRAPTRAASDRRSDIVWGVTFSQKMSGAFHLKWRRNYRAILEELKPQRLRLIAYWDLVEPSPGKYAFEDLDMQLAEAQKAGIPVVLCVGQKVPRWPEYHYPKWLDKDDKREREARLLSYLSAVVEHYRDSPALEYWQVENEPTNGYGIGPDYDPEFLEEEIGLVHRIDPRHGVMETDGGEHGRWRECAQLGDAFGHTLYRYMYNKKRGQVTSPLTPSYYSFKTGATKQLIGRPDEPFVCIELQAEPWGRTLNPLMSIEEQLSYFPPRSFDENIGFARDTGIKTFYLWGAEWWYYMKANGHPEYWERAKTLYQKG